MKGNIWESAPGAVEVAGVLGAEILEVVGNGIVLISGTGEDVREAFDDFKLKSWECREGGFCAYLQTRRKRLLQG